MSGRRYNDPQGTPPHATTPPSPRQPTGRLLAAGAPPGAFPDAGGGALAHELAEAEVAPGGLAAGLGGALDAEGGVLVGDDVVLVLGVDGLVLGGDVDVVGRQAVAAELLEQVGVARAVQMDLRVVGVLVLERR